jgi:hypothetical protein
MEHKPKYMRLVRLSLSAKSASHLAVFFSHNKSVNSNFNHRFSTKRTSPGWYNKNANVCHHFLSNFDKVGETSCHTLASLGESCHTFVVTDTWGLSL